MKTHLRDNELIARLREYAAKPAPYNLTVHTYSNLTLDAKLRQDGFAPGDAVHLTASLAEYRAPLTLPATVWADVVQPDGSRATLPFIPGPAGEYGAKWPTSRPGIYQFAIRAEGRTTANARFTRAKELTAGVWAGGDRPFDPVGGGSGGTGTGTGTGDAQCKTMLCLIEQAMKSRGLRERLKALGLDLDDLRRCLASHCGKEHRTMERQRPKIAPSNVWRTVAGTPELARLIGVLASSGLDEMKVLEAAKTTPVKRKPKMEGSDENMFLPPEELEKRRAAAGKKKK